MKSIEQQNSISDLSNIEDSQAHLAAIVASSDDAIISKNLNGIITSWNASAERLFGYTSAEAIGQHISIIIPEDRLDEEYVIIGKIKEGNRVDHFQTIRQRKDKTKVELSITVSPVRNSQGIIIGASKIARNISEQKRIEEALKESNRRRDEFLANISHELRTPMNAVLGLTNILETSPNLDGKEKQYLKTLKQSAEGLLTLINNLLDFSRLDSGMVEIDSVEFDLTELMKQIETIVRIKAIEKNLELRISYDANMPKFLISDAFKIQQIVTNLLANAVKFTDNGRVGAHFRLEDSHGVLKLVMEVSDTGIGIPEEKIPVIFEKFTQADSSITRKYGGSGLGLSIVKGFVDAMGGSIIVKSRLGLGTVFTVSIPVEKGESSYIIHSNVLPSEKISRNVLIVDDYEPNVIVISAVLEKLGLNFDVADNGMEAVRCYQGTNYDVILMDVQMHEMDGFESTRRIREIEQETGSKPVPIIAMTAHVQERDKSRCLDAGMNDFIPKPFDLAVLETALRAHIDC